MAGSSDQCEEDIFQDCNDDSFSNSLLELIQSESECPENPDIKSVIGAAVLDQFCPESSKSTVKISDTVDMQQMFVQVAESVFESRFDDFAQSLTEKEMKKEKEKRRAAKDTFGEKNKECLIVDSKLTINGRELCDSIMLCSNSVLLWESTITDFYKERNCNIGERKSVSGGYKILISKNESPFLTFTFYSRKNKIMVQPGKKDQANLKEWISDFTVIKPLVSEITIPKEYHLPPTSVQMAPESNEAKVLDSEWSDIEDNITFSGHGINGKSTHRKFHSTPYKRKLLSQSSYKKQSTAPGMNANAIRILQSEICKQADKINALEKSAQCSNKSQDVVSVERSKLEDLIQKNKTQDETIKLLKDELKKSNERMIAVENSVSQLQKENQLLRDLAQQKLSNNKQSTYSDKLKLDEIETSISVMQTSFGNLNDKVQQWEKKINKCVQSVENLENHKNCKEMSDELKSKIDDIQTNTMVKLSQLEGVHPQANTDSIEVLQNHLKSLEHDLNQIKSKDSIDFTIQQTQNNSSEISVQQLQNNGSDPSIQHPQNNGSDPSVQHPQNTSSDPSHQQSQNAGSNPGTQQLQSSGSETPPEQHNLNQTLRSNIVKGPEKRDRNNVFQAYFARVSSSDEVLSCLENIKASQNPAPDHNIFAFRTSAEGAGMFHGGEVGADIKLANLLQEGNCQNCLVVVARYVNGVHIRGDRFKNILHVASDILMEQGLLTENTGSRSHPRRDHVSQKIQNRDNRSRDDGISNRKTLWIHDSLYNKIDKRDVIENETVSKKYVPTIESATKVLQSPREMRKQVIISVGTNDLNRPEKEFIRRTDTLIETALNSYDSADIHICSIPPNTRNEISKIKSINSTLQLKCENHTRLHFIDTFSEIFEHDSQDITTDGCHFNKDGLQILQSSIGKHFSYPPLPRIGNQHTRKLNPHALPYQQQPSSRVQENPSGITQRSAQTFSPTVYQQPGYQQMYYPAPTFYQNNGNLMTPFQGSTSMHWYQPNLQSYPNGSVPQY